MSKSILPEQQFESELGGNINTEGNSAEREMDADSFLHVSKRVDSISGHDLVTHVLDHPDGGVEALIDLAGGSETDWLEFKAAMIGRPEDRKNPNENDADGHWHVAEAVVAMANSRGGAVLVGIDDDAKPVGLQAGDLRKVIEKMGSETFLRREIHDRLHPAGGPCTWKTGTR